jgi:hypothetical protein
VPPADPDPTSPTEVDDGIAAKASAPQLHDAIGNLPGATPVRQLMVTRALEYLDRLAAEARSDVSLQRELADAYQRVAQVQGGAVGANLGDTTGALQSYGKALAIRQALIRARPSIPVTSSGSLSSSSTSGRWSG